MSLYCVLNIVSASLWKRTRVPISASSVTQERLWKYSGIFMQPVHVNFQVCAKVHEEDESPWLQGQERLWCASDSSCPENRTASSPEHTASTALLTEQLSRSGMNITARIQLIFFWKVTLSKQVPERFEDCYISCWAQISSGDWKLDANTKGLPFWDLYPTTLLISCGCNSPADLCTIACLKEWHESFTSIE